MMYSRGKYIVEGKKYETFKLAMKISLLKRIVDLGLDIGKEVELRNVGDYLAIKTFFEINNKLVLEPEFITFPCKLSFDSVSKDIVKFKCS